MENASLSLTVDLGPFKKNLDAALAAFTDTLRGMNAHKPLILQADGTPFKAELSSASQKLDQLDSKSKQNAVSLKSWWDAHRQSLSQFSLIYRGVMDVYNDLSRVFGGMIQQQIEAQQATARVEAAVRSTGGAAGYSSAQLAAFAQNMETAFAFDADDILNNVTTPLLTFTKVSGQVFEEAQLQILNMSRTLGTDLQSAAMQVGKALQDPVDGVAALRRVGVSFSDDQQILIKSLVDTGRAAEAQRLILKELATEFGGQAAAYMETGAGKLAALKITFDNLAESLGALVLPVVTALGDVLKPLIEWFSSLNGVAKAALVITPLLVAAWYALATSAAVAAAGTTTLSGAFLAASTAVKTFFTSIGPVGWAIMGVGAAATALGLILGNAKTDTDQFASAFDQASSKGAAAVSRFDLLVTRLKDLREGTVDAKDAQLEMNRVAGEINTNYGTYLEKIDLTRDKWDDVAVALSNARQKLVSYYIAEATKGRFDKIISEYGSLLADIRAGFKKYGIDLDIYSNRTGDWPSLKQKGDEPDFGSLQSQVSTGASGGGWNLGLTMQGLQNSSPDDLVLYRQREAEIKKINALVDQANTLKKRIATEMPEYQEALSLLFNLQEPGSGSGGSGSGGGGTGSGGGGTGSSGRVDDLKDQLDAGLITLEQYYAQVRFADSNYTKWAKEQIDLRVANSGLADSERLILSQTLYAELEADEKAWTEQQNEGDSARRAALEEANALLLEDVRQYYEELQFQDITYYQWRKEQIEKDVKAMAGLSDAQQTKLIEQRVALLDKEKTAWERLPLEEVLARYRDFKSEMADTSNIGVAGWKVILDGLRAIRGELGQLTHIPGVSDIIKNLNEEIKVAQLNAAGKKGNWFWHSLLGFDPDDPADTTKINDIKSTFADLQSSLSNVLNSAVQLNKERWDAELARIDAVAEKEKWSQSEILRAKQNANKKFAEEEKKYKNLQKAMSLASATINIAEGVTKALTLGPILGPVLAAFVAALGAVQIALIAKQKFARGGLFRGVGGPRDDQNLVLLSDGEFVVNANATKRFLPLLDHLNNDAAPASSDIPELNLLLKPKSLPFSIPNLLYSHLNTPQTAFAEGGLVAGGLPLPDMASKLDSIDHGIKALIMNLASLDLSLTVINQSPDIKSTVDKQERVKARQSQLGKAYQYGI